MDIKKDRIGRFFFFIGILLLIVFFNIDQSESASVPIFFSGILLSGLGVFIIWRNWKRPPPAERFRVFRKRNKTPKDKQGDNK
jgi:uncharacterized membrane protein (DUF4010 family)